MDITPVPRPSPTLSRGRLLAALLVIGPIIVLVFLPSVLGLQRYVVTDRAMDGDIDGSISRGSVALTRAVPSTDLVAGDVIVFRPPVEDDASSEDSVTRRIVAIKNGEAWTRGDNLDADDPWRVDVSTGTYPRVVFVVPWIGRPFSGQAGQGGWWLLVAATVITLVVALVLAIAAPWRTARQRQRQRRRPPHSGPVAGVRGSP
ncbi:S24/S26 family peptidase [Nocardioides dilutus]